MKIFVKMLEKQWNIRWYYKENKWLEGIIFNRLNRRLNGKMTFVNYWPHYKSNWISSFFPWIFSQTSQDDLDQEPVGDNNPSTHDFEDKAIKFERQKITDIRQILLDLTMIQLKECAKSMEILSAVYNDIAAIDVDKDLEVSYYLCWCIVRWKVKHIECKISGI